MGRMSDKDKMKSNMVDTTRPEVASLVWKLPSQLHEVQAKVIQEKGYPHQFFFFNEPIPPGTKIVFVQGPYGSLLPFVRNFIQLSRDARPVLVYWFQQSLDMSKNESVRFLLSQPFSDLHRYFGDGGFLVRSLKRIVPSLLETKGARLGYLGDIIWLNRRGLLDVLALSSTEQADYLSKLGVPSIVVPRGYHPDYGSILNLERDIAVVWMGKLRTRRRWKAVHWLKHQMEKRRQKMHIYDGEEKDLIYGDKRTQILNRSWFVLNVFFSGPTDELSIRFVISGANGAVVLSEPGKNKYPFLPGKHLVECPVKEMPEIVMYYLDNKGEWEAISRNMLKFLREEGTLESSVSELLSRAEQILIKRNS
jgi:hypothetical protein